MCNPPFYSSKSELEACAKAKSRPANSACTGADFEIVTEGGEAAFVSRMIAESKHLEGRFQWYTSMLGKSSSVETIVQRLKEAGIENWAVKDLIQGNRTKRWAVAWSWQDLRPSEVGSSDVTHYPAKTGRLLPEVRLPFQKACFPFHLSLNGPYPRSAATWPCSDSTT